MNAEEPAGTRDRRIREEQHGPWNKAEQRYADGCDAYAPTYHEECEQ